jgi:hypothetical protein
LRTFFRSTLPILSSTLLLGAACGSSGLQVRAPAGQSAMNDVLLFQESILALVAKSSSPEDAAARVADYCAKHGAAVANAFSTLDAQEDPGMNEDFEKKMQALLERAEKEVGAKADYMQTEAFGDAASACRGTVGDEPEMEPMVEDPAVDTFE